MPQLSKMTAAERSKKIAPAKKDIKKSTSKPLNLARSNEKISDSDLESETEESESDSDSEEEIVVPVSTLPPKVNGVKKEAESDSSSSDSEKSEDESESEESSESGSEGNEDVETELPANPAAAIAVAAKESGIPAPELVKVIKEVMFSPSTGFEIISGTKKGNPKASEFFHASNLDGRQLWYITAPASIPVSAIKKISLKDVQSGKPAIAIKGQDYAFIQEKTEEHGTSKMMVPEESGRQYRLGRRPIDQTLHLQRVVRLTGKDSTSKATVPAKKLARAQPDGLKMRFKPIGFGSGKTGTIGSISSSEDESDEEMEDTTSTFRTPKTVDSDAEMEDAQAIKPEKDAESSDSSSDSSKDEPLPLPKREKPTLKRKSDDTTDGSKLKKAKTKSTVTINNIAAPKNQVSESPIPPPKLRTTSTSSSSAIKPAKLDETKKPKKDKTEEKTVEEQVQTKKDKKEKKDSAKAAKASAPAKEDNEDPIKAKKTKKKTEKAAKKGTKVEGSDIEAAS